MSELKAAISILEIRASLMNAEYPIAGPTVNSIGDIEFAVEALPGQTANILQIAV